MNLFKTVKDAITVKQAAALYSLPTTTTWMVRYPFHEDHTPSMKLNDTYYYCFGCSATGDVIDLTAQWFGLSSFQAARKLAQDFGLSPDKPPIRCNCSAQTAHRPFGRPARRNLLLSPGPPRLPRPANSVADRVRSPLPGGTAGRSLCGGSAHDGRCGRPH